MNLFSIWLKELKSFFQYDAKNWTFLVFQYDSKNWTFFSKCSRNWNLSSVWITFYTTRIELFFDQYDSKSRIFHISDSKCWTPFFEFDWKSWTFFALDSKNWTFVFIWLKELNFWVFVKKERLKGLSFSQKHDTKNWTFFNMTQRIFEYDSKNWTLLLNFNMTQRLFPKLQEFDFFQDSQTWTFFFFFKKNDSKNWSLFFTMTLKMEFFFSTNTTHRTDFFQYDSENWTFLKMTFFRHLTFFFEYDSKNWNSPIRLTGFKLFSLIWLKVLNFFCMTLWIDLFFFFQEIWLDSSNGTAFYEPLFKMTQRVEVFLSDSKNWTFLVFQCDSKNSLRQTGKKFNALRQVRKKLNSLSQIMKRSIL